MKREYRILISKRNGHVIRQVNNIHNPLDARKEFKIQTHALAFLEKGGIALLQFRNYPDAWKTIEETEWNND